jgi:CMP/dCMP kinase
VQKINIAIDGYSACGKSTTARLVARQLGFIFIDSGAMYRAISLHFIRNHVDFNQESPELLRVLGEAHLEFHLDQAGIPQMFLNGRDVEHEIRSSAVSNIVSEVSTLRAVRVALVAQQRRMGEKKGVVMDGRDIGTVVFPDAELKIFMTASLSIRIIRRAAELIERGIVMSDAEIEENILHRDHIDSTREESPLRKADDAIELDTTGLTIPQQVDFVVGLAQRALA